jgi:RNA polymerase sigma-70 factor, ECF subfamily
MTIIPTETIWQEMYTALNRFIAKRVADESAVDDILQDVFLRIHTHAESLKDNTKLESWIYQITRHVIVDYYRSQKSEANVPETLPIEDEHDEDDLTRQLTPCLRRMIQDLPEKYRDALVLTEYEGLSQSDLATHLGISFSGAKSRVQRAKEQLKGILLQCCRFELDRLGKIIDYIPSCGCCGDQQNASCQSNQAVENL